MSITLSTASAELKSNRSRAIGLALVITLAGLLVLAVSSLFAPLTDADRAEMIIDATHGLPQDRPSPTE